jgi:hypothetical protein
MSGEVDCKGAFSFTPFIGSAFLMVGSPLREGKEEFLPGKRTGSAPCTLTCISKLWKCSHPCDFALCIALIYTQFPSVWQLKNGSVQWLILERFQAYLMLWEAKFKAESSRVT